jgi:hypothetical protein
LYTASALARFMSMPTKDILDLMRRVLSYLMRTCALGFHVGHHSNDHNAYPLLVVAASCMGDPQSCMGDSW